MKPEVLEWFRLNLLGKRFNQGEGRHTLCRFCTGSKGKDEGYNSKDLWGSNPSGFFILNFLGKKITLEQTKAAF